MPRRAVFGENFVTEGGLMSYFSDTSEQYRLAPFYVDRILKGTRPGDLPVQLPTRFRFVVNRKAAASNTMTATYPRTPAATL